MLLTIITINYNNSAGLIKTIESVINQTYERIEYIIIDGGSTDGSIDSIKKYAHQLSFWVSEKDKGVYHAMNKGIVKSTGDYLLFLNSGDYLTNDEVLSNCFTHFEFDRDIIYGDLNIEKEGKFLFKKVYPNKVSFDYFFNGESLPHPASLIKRELFDSVGLYNENFKIVSDLEFWLKAIFLKGASYKRIPIPISVFNLEGVSSGPDSVEKSNIEKEIVYAKYFSGIINDYKRYKFLSDSINTSRMIKILRKLGLIKV